MIIITFSIHIYIQFNLQSQIWTFILWFPALFTYTLFFKLVVFFNHDYELAKITKCFELSTLHVEKLKKFLFAIFMLIIYYKKLDYISL